MRALARYADPDMPVPKKPKVKNATLSIKAGATSTATARVRVIRPSPIMDLKKVEEARQIALKIKRKNVHSGKSSSQQAADDMDDSDVPFVTPGL